MSAPEVAPTPQPESSRGGGAARARRPRKPRGDRPPNTNNNQEAQSDPQSHAQSQLNPQQTQTTRRRGGGGRGRGGRDASLALRPASVAPSSADVSSAEASAVEQGSSRPRQPRRGRGGASARGRENRTVNGRPFGGQLTQDADLQGDAAVFVPGQQSGAQTSSKQPQRQRQQQRRLSKSTAPDIATRTHHDIDNQHYECAICTNEVLRNSKVWSCKTCWTVFHLSCIKKWSSQVDRR